MPGMLPRMRFSISGWLFDNSAISASPQPKRAAPSSIAAAIAVVPLVIPAYDILSPEAARQILDLARRQDRQEEIGAFEERPLIGGRFHSGGASALGALGAPPAEQRADLGTVFVEPLPDPRAHAALRNDGNGDAHDYPIRKTNRPY